MKTSTQSRTLTQAERDFRTRRWTWIGVIVISLLWAASIGAFIYAKVSA